MAVVSVGVDIGEVPPATVARPMVDVLHPREQAELTHLSDSLISPPFARCSVDPMRGAYDYAGAVLDA